MAYQLYVDMWGEGREGGGEGGKEGEEEGREKGKKKGGRERMDHNLYSKHSPAFTTLYTGGWFCILAIGSFTSTCPSGNTPCKPVMDMYTITWNEGEQMYAGSTKFIVDSP